MTEAAPTPGEVARNRNQSIKSRAETQATDKNDRFLNRTEQRKLQCEAPPGHFSPFTFHFSPAVELLVTVTRSGTALLALLWAASIQHARATGFYGPQVYLDDGGANLTRSPEFYWDVEVKRLARNLQPIEKRIPIRNSDGNEVCEPGEAEHQGAAFGTRWAPR